MSDKSSKENIFDELAVFDTKEKAKESIDLAREVLSFIDKKI